MRVEEDSLKIRKGGVDTGGIQFIYIGEGVQLMNSWFSEEKQEEREELGSI